MSPSEVLGIFEVVLWPFLGSDSQFATAFLAVVMVLIIFAAITSLLRGRL